MSKHLTVHNVTNAYNFFNGHKHTLAHTHEHRGKKNQNCHTLCMQSGRQEDIEKSVEVTKGMRM